MLFILFLLVSLINAEVRVYNWTLTQGYRNWDGVYKLVYLINNNFPPKIEIMKNDEIDLTLLNNLYAESTSLHWHGLNMETSPYMDGVPYVTQYPILTGQSFRYNFKVNQTGSYWLHSHLGAQYGNGLYAPVIIHDSEDLYDIMHQSSLIQGEQILTIGDWYHQSGSTQIAILQDKGYPWYFPPYTNVLWNGKGFFNCSKYSNFNIEFETTRSEYDCVIKAYPKFQIQSSNLPLRFRIVNTGSGLTLVFSIDHHQLTVITVDGVDVKPFLCERILIYVGQRYDVLVYPLSSEVKSYWMRTNTLDYPIGDTEQSLAILNYDEYDTIPTTTAWNLNSKNLTNLETNLIPKNNLFKIHDLKDFHTVTLNINCSYTEYLCTINDIAYKPDFIPILLQSYNKIDIKNPAVIKLPHKKYVKLIINSRDAKSHSLHKHNTDFWILGVGAENDGSYYKQTLNTINPVYRDTIQINGHSWVVLLFHTTDIGAWFFHCHVQYHSEHSMNVVFLVEGDPIAPPNEYPMIVSYSDMNILVITKDKVINLDNGTIVFLVSLFTIFGGILIYLVCKRRKKFRNYGRL
jgi:FtsP/CotA-like multicopper oxidase with cupredoxin domain